jgi:fatty-acyl-CoA synthase
VKVLVVDEEGHAEREAETDEIGSICVKGPNVFGGYLEAAHNRAIWAKEGWLNTGDLGRQDADGYFWLTGRKKELIIRGGHNIDPAVIEDPLYRLDQIQTAAAVGRPDPHAGEVPVVYVELQEGATLTADAILDYLRKEVGERAAVPKEVYVLDTIPLTADRRQGPGNRSQGGDPSVPGGVEGRDRGAHQQHSGPFYDQVPPGVRLRSVIRATAARGGVLPSIQGVG